MRRESGFSQWPAFFNVFQHLKTRVPQIICTEPTRFRHTQLLNNRSALQPHVQELIYQIDCLWGDDAVQNPDRLWEGFTRQVGEYYWTYMVK